MERERLKKQLLLSWISVIAVLVGITAVTFAWFSFHASTNVEPIGSTISEGDASLMIANRYSGPFEEECALEFDNKSEALKPVSTMDLTSFYKSKMQNQDGKSILYGDVTNQLQNHLISGKLYLKSTGGDCKVYFLPSAFKLGLDSQCIAALRLGMKITVDHQETVRIFSLESMATGPLEEKTTILADESVVESIDHSGRANYKKDSSVPISEYMAVEKAGETPVDGEKVLCDLSNEQVATVEYFIYLEGCDVHCINAVQSKDIPIQLGFAGIPKKE